MNHTKMTPGQDPDEFFFHDGQLSGLPQHDKTN